MIDYSKTPVDSVVDQVDAVLDGTGTQSDSRKRILRAGEAGRLARLRVQRI